MGIVQRVSDFKVLIKILKITNPKLSSYSYNNIPYHIKAPIIVTVTRTIRTRRNDATIVEKIQKLQMNHLFLANDPNFKLLILITLTLI